MTQDPTVVPEVQAALNAIYQQGFEAGRLKGYEEGMEAGGQKAFVEGIKAAKAYLANIPMPEVSTEPLVMLSSPIEELDLSVRAYTALKREGIYYISDLIKKSEADLYVIQNLGVKSIDEVKAELGKFGYKLAPSPPGFDWSE